MPTAKVKLFTKTVELTVAAAGVCSCLAFSCLLWASDGAVDWLLVRVGRHAAVLATSEVTSVAFSHKAVVGSRSRRAQVVRTKQSHMALKFIHITKTAGGSIAALGKRHGLKWGEHDRASYGLQHGIFSEKPEQLRRSYDWFMVVRNPYTRLLSEFYCVWGGVGKRLRRGENFTVDQFNSYLVSKINQMWSKPDHYIPFIPGHYIPMSMYLDPTSNVRVLRFENLTAEFNELMREYHLRPRMKGPARKHAAVDLNSRGSFKFTPADIGPELRSLIGTVYHDDFVNFGYSFTIPLSDGHNALN